MQFWKQINNTEKVIVVISIFLILLGIWAVYACISTGMFWPAPINLITISLSLWNLQTVIKRKRN